MWVLGAYPRHAPKPLEQLKGCHPSSPHVMKLAIIGSRNFTDQSRFDVWMTDVVELWGMPTEVVSGGARGADTLGERWAKKNNIPTSIFRPDWIKYGKAAGPIRNRDIIAQATHVVAFPSRRGRGTQHSIGLTRKDLKKKLQVYWID